MDAIIERLKERVGRTHLLFSQEIFVSAVSNEPEAALLEIDTEQGMEYAVVSYHGKHAHQEPGVDATPEVVYKYLSKSFRVLEGPDFESL